LVTSHPHVSSDGSVQQGLSVAVGHASSSLASWRRQINAIRKASQNMRRAIRHRLKYLALTILVAVPLGTWEFWKPIRALAPELAGMKCYAGKVCIDDPSKVKEALSLRREALQFVERKVGSFQADPRVIFCTMPSCERSFGFTSNAAYSLGTAGVVVSAHGWQPHYIRHELIHCVQVERIGGFRMLFRTPSWLIEGMAYSMSEDPRRPLGEPWEKYRNEYEQWALQASSDTLWQRAADL
jgi:hypothetical protein